MDAALRLGGRTYYVTIIEVSILVLMDAALRHFSVVSVAVNLRLIVSILVLMDAALRQRRLR